MVKVTSFGQQSTEHYISAINFIVHFIQVYSAIQSYVSWDRVGQGHVHDQNNCQIFHVRSLITVQKLTKGLSEYLGPTLYIK